MRTEKEKKRTAKMMNVNETSFPASMASRLDWVFMNPFLTNSLQKDTRDTVYEAPIFSISLHELNDSKTVQLVLETQSTKYKLFTMDWVFMEPF